MFYSIAKYILKYIASIFFQEVSCIGEHFTPLSGPVILCGNHSNQFCDPLLILSQCRRETSFLVAESSFKKKIIGFFGRLLHAIPVKRPQDYVSKGSGLLTSSPSGSISGQNTKFTKELHPGDVLKVNGEELLIKSIESDNLLISSCPKVHFNLSEFKILPKIDQSHIYEAVHTELKQGRCIGIFPEGGSHDRTTPLPLKAGVCLMALGAMAQYNITVTIQCIGLNYYQGHRFRSKAVLNFGVPYTIPRELATLYMQDRKKAIEILLKQIEKRLKEVWVTAPSYDELSQIFLARQIVRPDNLNENPSKIMELNLKFAKGYKYMREKYPDNQEFDKVVKMVKEYSQKIDLLGLNDANVRTSETGKIRFFAGAIVIGLRIIAGLVLSLPSWVLGGMVGSLVRRGAEKERKKALAASSVKIYGYDVLASYKIVYGTVIFSLISVFLGSFTFIYSYYYFSSIFMAFYSIFAFSILWPIYMYLSIILSDRAFRNFRRLYMQTLTICSPVALESALALRDQIKASIKSLTKQYAPEIFPELKSKKPAKAKIVFNDSINDAFGLLSEIGFS